MKNELEQLRKEMNERIDALLKPECKFEVGQWLYYDGTGHNTGTGYWEKGVVCKLSRIIDSENILEFNLAPNTEMTGTSSNRACAFRLATHSEIESALVEEAKRRGFKEGVMTKSAYYKDSNEAHLLIPMPAIYELNEDRLLYMGMYVYYQGQWAAIIKDDKIEIGGYEVKFSKNGTGTKIDGNHFSKEFWQAAKVISKHTKAKIMVGCSKQFDVSLETINAILAKL